MTLQNATAAARSDAKKHGIPLAIVREGPHAGEYAERDADGHSYGFCPVSAVPTLYKHGTVISTTDASGGSTAAPAPQPSADSRTPESLASEATGGQGGAFLPSPYSPISITIPDGPQECFLSVNGQTFRASELAALRSRAAMAGRLAECVELFARYFAENGGDQEYHQADGAGWVTLARTALAEFRKL
jgi:hypothetical protein